MHSFNTTNYVQRLEIIYKNFKIVAFTAKRQYTICQKLCFFKYIFNKHF